MNDRRAVMAALLAEADALAAGAAAGTALAVAVARFKAYFPMANQQHVCARLSAAREAIAKQAH